jgi:hypothetical protein
MEYFGFGEYEFGDHRVIVPVREGISGTHRMNGIGIFWGKPVQNTKIINAKLEDFAPSILHMMGLQIPAHMDGRPLTEILRDDADLPPPDFGPAWEGKQVRYQSLDEDEEESIRQRLKDLGYVA